MMPGLSLGLGLGLSRPSGVSLEAQIAAYRRSDGELPVLVFDRFRDFYYFDGEAKTLADWADVGTGHLLGTAGWLNSADFSVVIDYNVTQSGAYSATETLFSLDNNMGHQISVAISSGGKGLPLVTTSYPSQTTNFAGLASAPQVLFGRNRVLASFSDGAASKYVWNAVTEGEVTSTTIHDTLSWVQAGFNYREIATTQDQHYSSPEDTTVVVYGSSMDAATRENTSKLSWLRLPPIHWMGDSISNPTLYDDGGGVVDRVKKKAEDGGYNGWSTDIVGGTNLEQFATRYAATTDYHNRNLVVFEGGLDYDGVDTLAGLTDILSNFTGADWVFIEPIPASNLPAGSADRDTWEAELAPLISLAGESRVIRILQALQDANDGSAGDLEDVANDIVPRSLRVDGIHLNAAGQEVVAGAVYPALKLRGWLR